MAYVDIDLTTAGDDPAELAKLLVQLNENVRSLRDPGNNVVPEIGNNAIGVGSNSNRIQALVLREGDMVVGSLAGVVRLGAGRAGQILTITGKQPSWQNAPTVQVLRSSVLRYA